MDRVSANRPKRSECSYLYVRDSGISATEITADEDLREKIQQEREQLGVYLRMKKVQHQCSSTYKISEKQITCVVPPGSNAFRNCKSTDTINKIYSFSKIFDSASQLEIFNEIVKPKLLGFINGSNCTLFTYGASGSGKTFTIFGNPNDPGLIPRTFDYLFRTLPPVAQQPLVRPCANGDVVALTDAKFKEDKVFLRSILNANDTLQHVKDFKGMQKKLSAEGVGRLDLTAKNIEVGIWISFAEIYNEQIFDLLQPAPVNGKKRKRLQLGAYDGNHFIKNLSSVAVKSGEEAYKVLHYGLNHLNYASTGMNNHSSRSHSIFTIKLIQVNREDGCVYCNSFNFCDLAGSERIKNTKNQGVRLQESNNINSSLLVLGRCIQEVRNAQKMSDNKVIPFRESKLTQLFQKALSGNEDISMIVTINPDRELFDENVNVLNFAAIAKQIECKSQLERSKKRTSFLQFVESAPLPPTPNVIDNGAQVVPQAVQCKQDEICKLYEVIDSYKQEFESLEGTYEEKRQKSKQFYMQHYKTLLEKQTANFEAILRNYEVKIKNLEKKCDLLAEQRPDDNSVILLDSSDDDDDADDRYEIMQLKRELNEQKKKNDELTLMLNEAVHDYRELRYKLNSVNDEILMLREKNADLERELFCYRTEMAENIENGDEDSEEGGKTLVNTCKFNDFDFCVLDSDQVDGNL